MAKILLLGGTGAMGVYLVPELINLGHDVFVTSRSVRKSSNDKLTYIQGNAHDYSFLVKILANNYDVIIDFMLYNTNEFRKRYELLLSKTNHYIFVSSCGVFAESKIPITENSPRLLDILTDSECLATDAYVLTKARQENILRESQYTNWTIVRPTITYSKTRFDFGSFGENTFIVRALNNAPVIFPQEMLEKQTTMTWAGDVAKMIAQLVLNKNAFCEDYNVCTNEHHSWEEIAKYYEKLIGLIVMPTDINTYLKIINLQKYPIKLNSRLQNKRIMNNSKILKITNMKQENLMPLFDGLAKELSNKKLLKSIKKNYKINKEMDRIINTSIQYKIYYYILEKCNNFNQLVMRAFRKIKNIFKTKKGEEAYIWGAGNYGTLAVLDLEKRGKSILGFIDNNKDLQGNRKLGYKIFSPEKIIENKIKIIIALLNSDEVTEMLLENGYIFGKDFEVWSIPQTTFHFVKPRYKVGYTTGVFDLFHIGHLNILKKAKEQCEYLIVGVSTDELVMEYKNKKPVISFKARKQIIEAIKYVDKVVTQETLDKVEAYFRLKYNVLFHGDDWKNSSLFNETIKQFEKIEEKPDVVFFPITKNISSTKLSEMRNEKQGRKK